MLTPVNISNNYFQLTDDTNLSTIMCSTCNSSIVVVNNRIEAVMALIHPQEVYVCVWKSVNKPKNMKSDTSVNQQSQNFCQSGPASITPCG